MFTSKANRYTICVPARCMLMTSAVKSGAVACAPES